ncbi:MAG TPA: alpha/beta hydrolase [Rhizomicrobium sp.]|nr:alpha/beta hydrolase [Rhizomicrobium sp.]
MTDISSMRFSHIAVNGIRLHVAEAGPPNGPLVILLHGFPEFWYGWRAQIGPLAEAGYHVVVPDQRGYNLSDKPKGIAAYDLDHLAADVVALAGHYGHETFALVGHDWGAIVAWWTAQTYPQCVERVLTAGASHPAVWADAFRNNPRQRRKSYYVRLFQIPWLPEAAMRSRNFKLLADAISDTAVPGTVSEADLARYREAWGQPGALTATVNWYRAVRQRTLLPPTSYRIRVPAMMIWGMRDRYGEPELAAASIAMCDQGELVRFDNATHWVQHDEPERFTALLLEFLKRPVV